MDIVGSLSEAVSNLELAIEQEHVTRRAAKEATGAYDDAETEWTYDQMTAPTNGERITVDVRKAQIAAALVKARQSNGLARPYAAMNQAKYAAEDARMALDQAEKRYSATRAVAELTAAMLNAAK
jgi:shikimate kinase